MENILGLLILAVSLLLAAALVTAALTVADVGISETKNAIAETQKAISVEDVDFNRVKSNSISGVEVVQLVQKFDDSGYGHLVVTTGKPEGFYSADGINDTHSDNYINPDKKFSGSVITNQNDVVYAVRFIESGQETVEFDAQKAASEPKSMDRQIKDAQYSLFAKFLVNRMKCSKYMQLCFQWGEAIKQLDSAELRSIYAKYSKDSANQEEFMESQILTFDAQIRFYEAVTAEVKLWTAEKWWEAILSADLDSSSEPLDPGNDNGDDDLDLPWWADSDDSNGDNKADDSDSDSDSDSNDGTNTGDDEILEFTPKPSASVETPIPEVPIESELPVQTVDPGDMEVPTESELPEQTVNPDEPEESRNPGDSEVVPIVGPDSA